MKGDRFDLFHKYLEIGLKTYPNTIEKWREICNDFNKKKEGSFGYKIRKRMDELIDFNGNLSNFGHFKGWVDLFDAHEDLYDAFFKEINDVYRRLEDEYFICTDPIWLWENCDERSNRYKLTFLNDTMIPNKKVRIVVFFENDCKIIGNVKRVRLTIDDKSAMRK